MEVILVRHTSVDVPPGTCYGQTDVALCSTFPEEAEAVYRRLAGYAPFDRVYTSPLSRCIRLAEYGGYADAVRDSRLLELNFGAWEMQRYEEIRDSRLTEWYADYLYVPATGGESFAGQLRRVSSFLDELRKEPYRRVALFTHGGGLQPNPPLWRDSVYPPAMTSWMRQMRIIIAPSARRLIRMASCISCVVSGRVLEPI